MYNPIIAKTCNEEGKVGENLVWHYSKHKGVNIEDTRDVEEYQRKDVDFLIEGKCVEVKSDHIAYSSTYFPERFPLGTGNLTFECATHLRKNQAMDIINSINSLNNFSELENFIKTCYKSSIGCNFKTQAERLTYLFFEEETKENRRYMLKDIVQMKNIDLYNYVSKYFKQLRLRDVYQPEDRAYNLIFLINISSLINEGYAKRCDKMVEYYKENYPRLFTEYFSTAEQEKYLYGE